MNKQETKKLLKKVWYFIWEDDSIWSWIVNIILAFVLIKFIVYPGLGFILGTGYPIVAVVSSSMEHNADFDSWWTENQDWYFEKGILKDNFRSFSFVNGFNKGDIIVLHGKAPKDIKIGDVIVFRNSRPDPIIHRVVKAWNEDNLYYFQTKGDNNKDSIKSLDLDETRIQQEEVIGAALFRIPLLGYIKIWFVEMIHLFVR